MRKVTFTGNKHLKAGSITGDHEDGEKGWLSWFTGSGILDEEVLEEDRKKIEALYHDNGYVRVKVGRPDVTVSPDGKTISIAISRRGRKTLQDRQAWTSRAIIIFDEATSGRS